jgi:nucleotide-binding universal stress UspA family protein
MSNSQFKTILAPVDLSDRSRAVLEYACRLAAPLSARVEVLFVQPVTRVTSTGAEDSGNERLAEGRAALHRFVRSVTSARDLAISEHVELGNPLERIIEYARATAADLLVLGTHGRVGRMHALAGSQAESVVRVSPCPVVTLRQAG